MVAAVRKEIGPVACFKRCIILPSLPKTRSGKVLRRTLKAMVRGEKYKIAPTILDADILPVVEEIIKK